jgi:hypothetical protein
MVKATEVPMSRVLHVPLTQHEWRALRMAAMDTGRTIGQATADALRAAYPLTEGTK